VDPALEQLAIESNRKKAVAEEKRLPILETVAP
jgi:hypothetical protein